jgi:methionine aminotransferase
MELSEYYTRKQKLASIPVSAFYSDGYDPHQLRFCFAKKDETLKKAGAIIKQE